MRASAASRFRFAPRHALAATLGLALASAALPSGAGDNVGVLVLKEHGVGSASQAQPYVDRLVGLAATRNGWASWTARYHTNRTGAEAFIASDKPHYAILSLAALLSMKGPHKLEVIGSAEVAQAGGQQYFLISKTAKDLAGCKGKSLATDHADDKRFVDKVVFGGAFALGDFTLVETQRPMQTIKKVLRDEAACALVDDAQLAEIAHVDGGSSLTTAWKSDKLPPMVVVAFPSASASERSAFQASLSKLCEGEGKATCGEAGIQALKSASDADYAAVQSAYGK